MTPAVPATPATGAAMAMSSGYEPAEARIPACGAPQNGAPDSAAAAVRTANPTA